MDVLGVLLRRWRVLLIGALITVAAAGGAILAVPTNYQATGQLILLLPAQASGTTTPTNPYLNLDPGLTVAATLISSTLSTKESMQSVKAAGFTGKYAIELTPGEGPLLNVSVESTDPAQAVATRDEVMRRLARQLVLIQNGESVPTRQFIHARENSVIAEAEPLPGSKIRAIAAIGAVGVLLTLGVAFVRDRRRFGPLPRPAAFGVAAADDQAGQVEPGPSRGADPEDTPDQSAARPARHRRENRSRPRREAAEAARDWVFEGQQAPTGADRGQPERELVGSRRGAAESKG